MIQQFTREQLYTIVWAEPMQKLAAKYGMSDVGFAKICRRVQVPVPERGYWAKLQAGRPVVQPPLPMRPLGMLNEIEIGERPRSVREEAVEEPRPPPPFIEGVPELTERVRGMVGKATVARNLDSPHAAIAKLLQADERRREKRRQGPYPSLWDGPLFDSPLERRRLRILSALFSALERAGAVPSLSGRDARELRVLVGSVQISFQLDRVGKHDHDSHARRTADDSRTEGPLVFRVENSSWWKPDPGLQWRDTTELKLEGVLNEITVQLLVSGETTLREWLQYRYEEDLQLYAKRLEEARRKREEIERKERERISQLEQDRVDQLLQDAASWTRAGEIRAFVRARIEATSTRIGSEAAERELDAWSAWALEIADRMDPLARP